MSLLWIIIIGLGASIIGGLISGRLVIRKVTHDTKRLYARQIKEDFEIMSILLFMSARSFLELIGYHIKDFDANQPKMIEKVNQTIVNQVRKEYQREYERRLLKYDLSKLISQVEELVKDITNETTGFNSFFSKYPLHASYFDALYQASSAVELIIFWRNQIPEQINEEQKRICISNVTSYLLDVLDCLLKASSEIKYYCKAKAWTWRLIVPTTRT